MASEGATTRNKTRRILVGDVPIGAGADVVVQSMCNTPTSDVNATLAQINELADRGCELIRVTLPQESDVEAFSAICKKSPLPVIADIHFNYRLAIKALEKGAAAIRINPGNIGSFERVDKIIQRAATLKKPIRIGVNAGSLAKEFIERSDMTLQQKLVESACCFARYFEEHDFFDFVVSAKVHSVKDTVEVYRELASRIPHTPLHLGVTEAGTYKQGSIKNAIAIGALLLEGIGDTIRVSLTADPKEELDVAWQILSACGIRRRNPELVSCPTCGRTDVNLIEIASEVERRLQQLKLPISVAVMGCVVNGPGEARDADIGVACGHGQGLLFTKGQPLYKVPEDQIVDALFEQIDRLFQ